MSVFATISGILITGRVSSGSATNGIEYHMDAIASTVIGGVSMTGGSGNVMGVVGGGLDLMMVSPYLQQIFKGAIIVIAVVADNMKNRR